MVVRQNEKKKAKFRVSFLFLFIFASFAVCFVLYMKEDFEVSPDMIEPASNDVVYIEPVGGGSSVINPVPASERGEEDYYDDAVFIGSTALAGLSDYGYVKSANMLLSDSIGLSNFSSATLSADGVESGMSDAAMRLAPKKIYIMVGINDISASGGNVSFDGLKEFIGDIKDSDSGVKIYLMSLLPVTSENESRTAANQDIDEYNSKLLEFADSMNVYYLDVNTVFKGNDGKLPASYAEVNGVKLKKSGYEKLSEYILTHIG